VPLALFLCKPLFKFKLGVRRAFFWHSWCGGVQENSRRPMSMAMKRRDAQIQAVRCVHDVSHQICPVQSELYYPRSCAGMRG
jgi:hypothetical protein